MLAGEVTRTKAAEELGICRNTLRKWLDEDGVA
ncbi:MAG TPA: helix-turn-helix domain-containing protein [Candidatus Coprousia avicola]|nr:helix-turn-helix domain-containing protein [Candidatus Coprousia avicola]